MNKIDGLRQQLELLGLSEPEARIYLALLKDSPATVKELAHATEINRTSAYGYLDLLVEKELVAKLVKGKITSFVATSPEESLQYLIDEKLQGLQDLKKGFSEILPLLQRKQKNSNADIKYYKGKLGVKKIYEDGLQAKELRTVFNNELIKEALPDNEGIFAEALKKNPTIRIFDLFQDTQESRKKLKMSVESGTFDIHNERYLYKFLPPGVRLSAADILIYDGKVGIINVRNTISGVILNNEDYFNNLKELFDLIWKILPETNLEL